MKTTLGLELDTYQICIMLSCGTKKSKNQVDLYSIKSSAFVIILVSDVSKLKQEGKRVLVAGLSTLLVSTNTLKALCSTCQTPHSLAFI